MLWVITLPKCTGGAPHVLLALLLGIGVCGCIGVCTGAFEESDSIVESVCVGDWMVCWLEFTCGFNEVSVLVNTLLDAWSDSS